MANTRTGARRRTGRPPGSCATLALVVNVIDKRGANNPTAREHKAVKELRAQRRQAQADWTQQAAGTMFWEAQRARTPEIAEKILDKRAELITAAKAEKLPLRAGL
jgi:hypothetical protein